MKRILLTTLLLLSACATTARQPSNVNVERDEAIIRSLRGGPEVDYTPMIRQVFCGPHHPAGTISRVMRDSNDIMVVWTDANQRSTTLEYSADGHAVSRDGAPVRVTLDMASWYSPLDTDIQPVLVEDHFTDSTPLEADQEIPPRKKSKIIPWSMANAPTVDVPKHDPALDSFLRVDGNDQQIQSACNGT